MVTDRRIIVILVGTLVLISNACAVTVSFVGDGLGYIASYGAPDDGTVKATTTLTENGLEYDVTGNGNYRDTHSVSNIAGSFAEVGVDIKNADWYGYSYELFPVRGRRDPASDYSQVEARESLTVTSAEYIKAFANARNGAGYSVGVSTEVASDDGSASLVEYSNVARASADDVEATQTFGSASGEDILIKSESLLWESPAEPRGRAVGLTRSFKPEASVSTMVSGILSDYWDSTRRSTGLTEIYQEGHIEGTFTSTSMVATESKTRTSNYGSIYDMNMQAKIEDGSSPTASGTLGYYVDDDRDETIQEAVDAADSGDIINVNPGTYHENVAIEKSLYIKGAGPLETIVDGDVDGDGTGDGSVFAIGQDNSDVDVTLSSMSIQGGSGTYNDDIHGVPAYYGGGIFNRGTLDVIDTAISGHIIRIPSGSYGGGICNWGGTVNVDRSSISENEVSWYGGGIYNVDGTVNVDRSTISGNHAGTGAGIFNEDGTVNVDRSTISGNHAGTGAGIHNMDGSTLNVFRSFISGNSGELAAGIYNGEGSTLSVDSSTISGNTANSNAGGIYNMEGTLSVDSSTISGNTAKFNGGGIYNIKGTLTVVSSTISGNTANYENTGDYNGGGIYNSGGTLDGYPDDGTWNGQVVDNEAPPGTENNIYIAT